MEITRNQIHYTTKKMFLVLKSPVVSEDGHEWVFVWDAAKVAGEDIRYQEAFRIEEGKLLPSTNFQK